MLPRLMRLLRMQYALTFAVLGCILPYISIFCRDAGLDRVQIGYIFAIWSLAQVLSPVLIAWAADSHLDPRRLVLFCSASSAVTLVTLSMMHGVWPVMGVWTAYCLVSIPLLPLLDGIFFGLQRNDGNAKPPTPYHRVRVWGTIGYIVPSLFLFVLLYRGMDVAVALIGGAVMAVLAGMQAIMLPDPRPKDRHRQTRSAATDVAGDEEDRSGPGIPTAAAAKILLRPDLLVLCSALFLGQMASTALAAFYPVYLVERVGMAREWVGLVAQVGVLFEIFFVAGCGLFVRRLGTRGVLVAGLVCSALRLGLLAQSQDPIVAVGTQVFHGMLVVVLGVLPQPLLNRHAGDHFRHSIQGLYVMLMGCGKATGSLVGGILAAQSLSEVFGYSAVTCITAAALILFGFRDRLAAVVPQRLEVPPVESPVTAQ